MRVFLVQREGGDELLRKLEELPSRVHNLIVLRSLQDTVRRSRAELNRQVRAVLNVKLKDINSAVTVRMPPNTASAVAAASEVTGEIVIRREHIPVKAYPHKDIFPRGVMVQWRKGEKYIFRHWFVVDSLGSHVFARTGIKKLATKGRYAGKIREQIQRQAGPSVLGQVLQIMPELMEFSRSTFVKELQRRAGREFARRSSVST